MSDTTTPEDLRLWAKDESNPLTREGYLMAAKTIESLKVGCKKKRAFYVDSRSGCVAVREHVDYDISPGLHQDLPDVMAYWSGEKYFDDDGMTKWRVADWQLDKANKLCEILTA